MIRINDSLHTGITTSIFDIWIADDSTGKALPMSKRNWAQRTEMLGQARELLRSTTFHASDSLQIGCVLRGMFHGDSTTAGNARLVCVARLIDSATGAATCMLDSFVVSSSQTTHYRLCDTVIDLLSGTYFVSLQIDTVAVLVPSSISVERYPVAELSSFVGEEHLGKLHRSPSITGPEIRLSAQPNPFNGRTDIRFSIVTAGPVSVKVFDRLGAEVVTLLNDRIMEAGRYEIEFDGAGLPPGAYIIDLRTNSEHVTEKVILVR
jgi:hypothetical protein